MDNTKPYMVEFKEQLAQMKKITARMKREKLELLTEDGKSEYGAIRDDSIAKFNELFDRRVSATKHTATKYVRKFLEKYGLLLEPGRLKYSGIYNIFADDHETGERKEVGVISEYEMSLHTEMKGINTTWTFLFENPGAPACAVQYENALDQLLAIVTEEQ